MVFAEHIQRLCLEPPLCQAARVNSLKFFKEAFYFRFLVFTYQSQR